MHLHRPRQHARLDVAAGGDKIVRGHRMGHALGFLFDDWTFVEIGGDVVRRRPDQLDAAFMRLVIGLGAL